MLLLIHLVAIAKHRLAFMVIAQKVRIFLSNRRTAEDVLLSWARLRKIGCCTKRVIDSCAAARSVPSFVATKTRSVVHRAVEIKVSLYTVLGLMPSKRLTPKYWHYYCTLKINQFASLRKASVLTGFSIIHSRRKFVQFNNLSVKNQAERKPT